MFSITHPAEVKPLVIKCMNAMSVTKFSTNTAAGGNIRNVIRGSDPTNAIYVTRDLRNRPTCIGLVFLFIDIHIYIYVTSNDSMNGVAHS